MDPRARLDTTEHVLLLIDEAQSRARETGTELARTGGEHHLVTALEVASRELLALRRRLSESTHDSVEEEHRLSPDHGELAQVRDETRSSASAAMPRLDRVNEEHMAEVERVLFLMSEARRRAERAAGDLAKNGAEPHLVAAVEQAERELETTIDSFFKSTYFHVPKDQLALS